tara:strand:- start:460 stop:1134 length:675 start_codon:yes stop_codon:yes gene_type:complete
MINVNINPSWNEVLADEFNKSYFNKLTNKLRIEYNSNITYPHPTKIFNAFNLTPFNKVKVVIIGQDPYHGENQAHGLCFSVNNGVKIPPSLNNIFKELKSDLNISLPNSGNLSSWAEQGVLMLNSVLTVRSGVANSHKKIGWEIFTKNVIHIISSKLSNIVFILWGRQAQEKIKIINTNKHLILKSVHPSPLSAYNGFFGCKHFSKCNAYLKKFNNEEIDWSLR